MPEPARGPPADLTNALRDRYVIEREIGRGGNAIVYLATDRKHDRPVALKTLPPDLALSVRAERFLREIQIAAKLTHPHILPLYDSGEAGPFLYYVMPLVRGESLRERLRRERQLPVDEAVRLATEVAEVLDYAHRQGVVHRDIKPENILLQEGHALVADFGIARALTVASGEAVTESGVAVGTPAYMSPEQAAGRSELDGRSDIYSLACVLYEMLAGHPPFSGDTAQEVLARHALDPVPSLRAARDAVPEAVERTVRRALAKQPADRFAAAGQFAAALRAPLPAARRRRPGTLATAAVAALLMLAASAFAARAWLAPREASVAVLPFVNLSGDTSADYFSDGMTEELINALVQVEGLRVPARTSAFAFKGQPHDLAEVARRLRVAHVLEGSVRRAGNTIRVTAQLIKAQDGFHLWSQSFDREVRDAGDVLAIQSEIARTVVRALAVPGAGSAATAMLAPARSLEAYDLYLRGRYFWNRRTPEAILKAIDLFNAAVAKDSAYALAYSGLADSYVLGGQSGSLPESEAYSAAERAARRALALDSSLAEGHVSLARVLQNHRYDFDTAEQAFRRAIELNPNYALAHSWYGYLLRLRPERQAEAIRRARRGLELDPLSPAMSNNLGVVYYAAARFSDAVESYARAVELQPDWSAAWGRLGGAYAASRRYDEAIAFARRVLAQSPDRWPARRLLVTAHLGRGNIAGALEESQRIVAHSSSTPADLAMLAHLHGRAGHGADALRLITQLRANSPAERAYWQRLAVAYAGLGERDSTFAALERALEARFNFSGIRWNAQWDLVRADPRFNALVERISDRLSREAL